MARPLRIQYEGGLYHVTLRGNERKVIVRDDDDRHRFVDALGASVLRHGHAHLVVETPHANTPQYAPTANSASSVDAVRVDA